jgi:hypothetical protein
MMALQEGEGVMTGRSAGRAVVVVAMVATGLSVAQSTAHASTAVNCASKNLQTAINAAASGSTLLVKGTCEGVFTLTKNITLKGSPAATLDGDDLGSVLMITGTPTVHLSGLTITGGLATDGGGINSAGGSLTLTKVTVTDNLAFGSSAAFGGGIDAAAGSVRITSSSIVGNRIVVVASGTDTANANGGGIYSAAKLTITDSTVDGNRVTARAPVENGAAVGGGVYAAGSSLTITHSHIDNNRLDASGSLGDAEGGGCEVDTKSMSASHSTFSGNTLHSFGSSFQADAGGGGLDSSVATSAIVDSVISHNQIFTSTALGAVGIVDGVASLDFATSSFALTGSQITHNSAVAEGGVGGTNLEGGVVFSRGNLRLTSTQISDNTTAAHGVGNMEVAGGAVEAERFPGNPSSLSLLRSTIANNTTTASSSGEDASVQGGGIDTSVPLSIVSSTVSGNKASAVAGASDASETIGGGVSATWDGMATEPSDHITNSTIADNVASAKRPGGTPSAEGGGVWISGVSMKFTDATVAHNSVSGTGTTVEAMGGGIFLDTDGTATLAATILALNTAPTNALGPDCSGKLRSSGHNLVHSVAGCTFAKQASDKLRVSAHLGALAANGGPTRTMALLSGSPAINAIPKSACLVAADQRGVHRPQGKGCDIGAYERMFAKPKKAARNDQP